MGEVTYSIPETVEGLEGYSKPESGTTIDLDGVTFTEATESVNIPVTATIAANENYAETVINYNVVVVANDSKKTSENGIKSLFLKFLELSENGFKSIFLKIKELVNSMWN